MSARQYPPSIVMSFSSLLQFMHVYEEALKQGEISRFIVKQTFNGLNQL